MRKSRLKAPDHHPLAYYHCVSRVVDRQFVLGPEEKEEFVRLLRLYEEFCEVRVITYCIRPPHSPTPVPILTVSGAADAKANSLQSLSRTTSERMNFAATTSCPTKSPVRSSVASALHPLFAPRSPQTPSLPDARPHSDRFRCGGRESEFLAAMVVSVLDHRRKLYWLSGRDTQDIRTPNHRSNIPESFDSLEAIGF